MLLNFSVSNYRSINKPVSLSLRAQGLSEKARRNVAISASYKTLKTLAIYGANSSGKSNLIDAINTMSYCVISSIRLNPGEPLPYDPFLLGHSKNIPTMFEVTLTLDGRCYRYGFRYSLYRIEEEWLFCKATPRSKQTALFIRNMEGVGFDDNIFPEGIGNESKLSENRLFLSLCSQLGGPISQSLMMWFQEEINVLSGLSSMNYRNYTKAMIHERREGYEEAMRFYNKIQLGFLSLQTRIEEEQSNMAPRMMSRNRKKIIVDSLHNTYDRYGRRSGTVRFDFNERESAGTRKLFDLSGPIFNSLADGKILVIDELDAKMHPLISQYIIDLFNNPDTNPYNAQLIFSTHDTHLLSIKKLRRDQIWFTEKDDVEQTDLYCMMDIVFPDGTKPRNDSNYEKNYIAGRYGAIPYILND